MSELLLLSLLVAASPRQHPFAEGEQAYRAGRFQEARASFEEALRRPGAAAGQILFNLGNCAFRLGRHAEAAWYFRRAKLHLPRDQEVEFNLRLAERELGVDPGGQATSLIAALVTRITGGELLVLVGALETVSLLGLVLLRRRGVARGMMLLLLLVALTGAARLVQLQWFPAPSEGVVLSDEVAVRPAPDSGHLAAFYLRAGELVNVDQVSPGWVRVTHPRGRGWTERPGVGLVE